MKKMARLILVVATLLATGPLASASADVRNGYATQESRYFQPSGLESLRYAQGGGVGADIFGWALSLYA